jgi:hypothetical protein
VDKEKEHQRLTTIASSKVKQMINILCSQERGLQLAIMMDVLTTIGWDMASDETKEDILHMPLRYQQLAAGIGLTIWMLDYMKGELLKHAGEKKEEVKEESIKH